MKRTRKKLLLLGLMAALGAVWLILAPGCPLRNLTGIPCPGCGMCRAWMAFFQGRWTQALRFHPLFWLVPVVLWLGWRDFRPLPLTAAVTAALMVCYGIRLYFGWIQ